MKMFEHYVARIALYSNDVSSAYRIACAGERERGRKQRDSALKKCNPFRFKTHHLPKWNK